jgi:F-type H+-transporting ATPase subunit b
MLTNVTTFASENAEASGIAALGVDPKAFVIQFITFVLVFFVLRRYAFEPILKVMRERRETIESGVKLGEEMQKEKAKLESQVEAALHEARQKADGIIGAANDNARQAIRDAEDKAREKATGILKEADARIEQDVARARKGLEKELVTLISDATEAIIDEKVDAKKDAQLIERALKGRTA